MLFGLLEEDANLRVSIFNVFLGQLHSPSLFNPTVSYSEVVVFK